MKGIIILIMVTIMCVSVDASCLETNTSCTESIDCCSTYCRLGRCIEYGQSSDDVGITPCSTVRCRAGYTCVLQVVQCIQAPCPPIARCAPNRGICHDRQWD